MRGSEARNKLHELQAMMSKADDPKLGDDIVKLMEKTLKMSEEVVYKLINMNLQSLKVIILFERHLKSSLNSTPTIQTVQYSCYSSIFGFRVLSSISSSADEC